MTSLNSHVCIDKSKTVQVATDKDRHTKKNTHKHRLTDYTTWKVYNINVEKYVP